MMIKAASMPLSELHPPIPQQEQQVPSTTMQPQPQQDTLRAVAIRMRQEMTLKERIIHLQTFKWTFTGRQAVSFLQQQGLADSAEEAAELCQRMLSQGLFKSIYHKELFTSDGEVYRFSSSFLDGNKQKSITRIPGSITSTGLYKEIAKFGKTAAQPFKNIQLSLNDTFTSLGNLSIPTPPKPGQLVGSFGGSRPRSSGGNRPRTSGASSARSREMRRSQGGKLHGYSEGTHGPPDSASSLAALVSSMESLQASLRESTSLLRLDLQQHTALQERLVGLLMVQQEQVRLAQLLIAINAVAALLLLGSSGAYGAGLAACCLLSLVVWAAGPLCWKRLLSSSSSSSVQGSMAATGRILEDKLSRPSRGNTAAAQAGLDKGRRQQVADPTAQDLVSADAESDEVDDLEDSIPYSEDFDDWPDAPVMLCPDPAVPQEFALESPGPCHALPLNGDPIPFESELFRGVVAVHIRHLPTTHHALFKGKKRLAWVAFQGTFKQQVSMDHLLYGMEFGRQLSNLPAPWFIENMLLPLARKISPSLRVGTLEEPYFFSPLITASQVVNVSLSGQQPPLMEAKEDTRLLVSALGGKAGDGTSLTSRRKFFQVADNRDMCFSTDYVWTFHLWQEYVDFASYMLNLGYSSYDLTQHLDGQPLQVMCKDVSSGCSLINLHVWHANLVHSVTRRFSRPARASRISNASQEDMLPECSTGGTQGGADNEASVLSSPSEQQQQAELQALQPAQQLVHVSSEVQQPVSQPLPPLQHHPTEDESSFSQAAAMAGSSCSNSGIRAHRPQPSSASEGKLQRPGLLEGESSSSSDPSSSRHAAAFASALPQLSSELALQSLQQQAGHLSLVQSATEFSAAAAAGGTATGSTGMVGLLASKGKSDGCATSRSGAEGSSGRFSSNADASEDDVSDSPRVLRALRASVSSSAGRINGPGGASPLARQLQQRQQLQGLSVMGAL